jgi:hypothetical protein
MKVDLYTKIILTVIAVALLGILLQPYISTQPVNASTSVLDVNIKELGGRRIVDTLPVDIKEINNHLIYRNVLPVEIKN